MSFSRFFILLAALALPFGSLQAFIYDENNDGDLSNDGDNPSGTVINNNPFVVVPFMLDPGSNLFSGTMGSLGGTGPLDADVWSFTVAAGYYLTGINLTGYSTTSGSLANQSFMAITNGYGINMSDASQHLSNTLWGYGTDGFGNTYTNLLALLDAGPMFGGNGFDGPLPAGNYTFWIQEGEDQIHYTIDFVTSPVPVPEPGGALLLGVVGGLWCLRRRRR